MAYGMWTRSVLSLGVAAGLATSASAQGVSGTAPSAGTTAPVAGGSPSGSTSVTAQPTAATTQPASGTSAPPASGTSAPPASLPSAAEAQQANASAAYNVKLHDLERKVNELKEQVFRSKARLNLLKEAVLHGVIAGAQSAIVFKNEMGGMYVPVRYTFSLDGTEIFTKSDESGKLGDQKEMEIYNGSITPGNHTLSVQLVYQGNAYGVFSYLKGYKFTARSSHTFTAAEGKQLQIKVVGYEKGNPVTTDPVDRPAVDFRESIGGDPAAKPDDKKDNSAGKAAAEQTPAAAPAAK